MRQSIPQRREESYPQPLTPIRKKYNKHIITIIKKIKIPVKASKFKALFEEDLTLPKDLKAVANIKESRLREWIQFELKKPSKSKRSC